MLEEEIARSSNYLLVNQSQIIMVPYSMEFIRFYCSNIKFYFFKVIFIVNFYTPNFMNNKWSSFFFGSFANHF
jgi:hypothetical protein